MFFKQKSIYSLKLAADLFFLNTSFILSGVLAQSLNILILRKYMLILLLILNFVWIITSEMFDFYEDFDSTTLSFQFIKIIKNNLVQTFSCVFFIFLTKEDLFTRNFIVYNFSILSVFIFLRIIIFKKVFAYFRSTGKNIRNLAIVGAGELGDNFLSMLKSNPEYGYNFVGFIDQNIKAENVIGAPDNLDSLIQEFKIEEAVIALPNNDFTLIEEIIRVCNKNAVRSFIIPDYFKFVSKKFRISQFGNFPIITVRNEPLEELQWRFVKRAFDILLAGVASILFLSWLFPIIILLQKLTTRGPIFFMQDRVGINNKPFRCFKFRTMHINSDGMTYTPTDKNDPRVTKLGSFLRKSNLDEIPQVINVLLGDMSIVGPRPHMKAFNNVYKEVVEEIKLRTLVKPGITGWAQVHGLRGDAIDAEENKIRIKKRIEYDIWYIENWSLTLDIQIIMLTAWQMLTGKTKGY